MQAGKKVMRPEVRAGAGGLAPLGRIGVGEGRRAREEVGWSQPQRGRVGLGIKDVGWRFPALLCRLGPPPSQLVSPWASSDADPGADKQAGPF